MKTNLELNNLISKHLWLVQRKPDIVFDARSPYRTVLRDNAIPTIFDLTSHLNNPHSRHRKRIKELSEDEIRTLKQKKIDETSEQEPKHKEINNSNAQNPSAEEGGVEMLPPLFGCQDTTTKGCSSRSIYFTRVDAAVFLAVIKCSSVASFLWPEKAKGLDRTACSGSHHSVVAEARGEQKCPNSAVLCPTTQTKLKMEILKESFLGRVWDTCQASLGFCQDPRSLHHGAESMRPKPRQMSWNFGRKKWIKTKSSPVGRDGLGNPVVKEIGRGSAMAAVMGSRAVFSENVTGAPPQLDLMNEEGLPRVQAAGGEF
eukprot:bmy_01304T0